MYGAHVTERHVVGVCGAQIMREKLLFAITMDADAMDADEPHQEQSRPFGGRMEL
jgi:hypothetical protein